MNDQPRLDPQLIETLIWEEKYKWKSPDKKSFETSVDDTLLRAVRAVYTNDRNKEALLDAEAAVLTREFCPAGRELAGAGTGNRVTLVNCYVNATVEDSMATELRQNSLGILEAHNVASYSLQMGGGIGTDFSTIRPRGAIVNRTSSVSSGVLPFMHMWNAMSATIVSSGSRRGAMMATLRCDHPDLIEYIEAKHEPGVLNQFNLSILITDDFMTAIHRDEMWQLGFGVPRADKKEVRVIEGDEGPWYVYKEMPARELWDKIIASTYDYAEPGVIFIDRINQLNNLNYCETISCTNPCGEQPLPPYGACVLGYINLAKMVDNPFTANAEINYDRLTRAVRVGVRFLDNVINETMFPVPEMGDEARVKRRIGLGVMGLGNMLQMVGIRYGDEQSVEVTSHVMRHIRDSAYLKSSELAEERMPFPMYSRDEYIKGEFIQSLPGDIRDKIYSNGIRNGVLLTIAPTGTTSLLYGNVSGGVEPTFAWEYQRKVVREDGSTDIIDVQDYGYRLYKAIHGDVIRDSLPHYMVTSQDLSVRDHLVMQAACQKYIDASISKTINCPEEMSFEEFRDVYQQAYELGCKGCTTYRPNPIASRVRGAVLSVKSEEEKSSIGTLVARPSNLTGTTYKVKWPLSDHAFYVTINDLSVGGNIKQPFEIFINTKDAQHQEWISALTRSLSAIFRRGGDVSFVSEELKEVHSSIGGAWVDGNYVPSLVALIGRVVEQHFIALGIQSSSGSSTNTEYSVGTPATVRAGSVCPKCLAPTLVHQEGCDSCFSCGFSNCS